MDRLYQWQWSLIVRDHRTGRHRWEADAELAETIDYDDQVSAPTIIGEVICSRVGQEDFDAFALGTGQRLWGFRIGLAPSLPTVTDGMVLIGDDHSFCYAIRAATGSFRWEHDFREEAIETAPAVADGSAYVASHSGMIYALNLATGKMRWPAVAGEWNSASLAVSGETLLAGSGDRLLGIDTRTGERRWRRRLSSFLRRELAVGDGVAVACSESTVHAVSIANGRLHWECGLEGEVTSPSIAGNVIFVASQEPALLHALSLDDGHELWNVTLPGQTIGAPVVVSGKVCLTVGGGISVLRFDAAAKRSELD